MALNRCSCRPSNSRARRPSSPEEQRRDRNKNADVLHKAEWVRAIRENDPKIARSNFDYSGRLTEAMLLGNVSVRLGKPIEYDAATGQVTNCPEAARLVRPEFRPGWSI